MKKKKINLEETVEKLRRTELLLEISRKIAGLKTLEKILWTLIEFVTEIFKMFVHVTKSKAFSFISNGLNNHFLEMLESTNLSSHWEVNSSSMFF